MFPDAYFVHIVRDGRDVACSYRNLQKKRIDSKYAPDLPHDIREIAQAWTANVGNANRAFDCFQRRRVSEIQYEALVSEPRSSLEKLCAQLGEKYDSNMMRYHELNRTRGLEPIEFLPWKEKTMSPLIRQKAQPFLSQLTETEILQFDEIAGDMLDVYGYIRRAKL
jgi:hypothetical protein